MTTIHQRIFADIEAKIMSGEWQPGHRIPFEHELEAEYRCSRMTVSKALSALADRGMIVRRRRVGSFVTAPQIDRTVLDIQDIATAASAAGHAYEFRIFGREEGVLTSGEAARLGETAGAPVLRVQCLHVVDGRPHALERRLILLHTVPQARDEAFLQMPPGTWLLEQVAWTEARHVIRAVAADAATAQRLELARGDPCLLLTRQTWQNGRTVTAVEITHPGDRYQFTGVFHPSSR
ncbi:histidine utilization repressor [Ensifer soli]|uniref:histidine utilization repressor n=1 Tax=Ciceribacter sp. sgz301302 TaxID=3342379 RepID=UPI0035BA5555